jgi:hypothetical protein
MLPFPNNTLKTLSERRLLHNFRKNYSGVGGSLEGLKTTVFPAAMAGNIFHEGTAIGKFQAVITPTNAIGVRKREIHLVVHLTRNGMSEQTTCFREAA